MGDRYQDCFFGTVTSMQDVDSNVATVINGPIRCHLSCLILIYYILFTHIGRLLKAPSA